MTDDQKHMQNNELEGFQQEVSKAGLSLGFKGLLWTAAINTGLFALLLVDLSSYHGDFDGWISWVFGLPAVVIIGGLGCLPGIVSFIKKEDNLFWFSLLLILYNISLSTVALLLRIEFWGDIFF